MKKAILVLATAISVTSLLTCSNPFTAGLGDKVDLEAPSLEIKSHRNGDAVSSTFELAGTITDDGTVESLKISLDSPDNVIGSATINGDSWNYTYDSSELTDGDHEFSFVAKDNTNKSVSAKLLLTVDNNPPTVMVTTPTYYGASSEYNDTLTIKGEATDTTRVQEVFLSLYPESGGAPVVDNVSATGTSSWSYPVETTAFPDDVNYYLTVEAEDIAGNRSSYFYYFTDLLSITTDPKNVPNIEEINAAEYQNEPINSGILTGSLSDIQLNSNPDSRAVFVINQNSDLPDFTFVSPTMTVSPDENTLGIPQRLSGFVQDDDGIISDSVEISIYNYDPTFNDDANEILLDSDDSGGEARWVNYGLTFSGSQWSYDANLTDGDYYLRIRATDVFNVTNTSEAAPFRVSSFAPVVSIDSPDQGSYVGVNSSIDVQVTITGLGASDTVVIDPNGDDDYTDALPMDNDGGGLFSKTLSAGVDFTVTDGPQRFKVRAGQDGSYGHASLQVTGDTTIPTAAINYPAASEAVNENIKITGTSSDDNQIQEIYLQINEGSEAVMSTAPSDWAGWLIPSSADLYNWEYGLDTTTLTDGSTYTIHVFAVDGAGNISDPIAREFSVDQSTDMPVFDFSNFTNGGSGTDNGFGQDASIIGIVEDDDAVDVSTLMVRIDLYNDGDFSGVDLSNPLDGDTADLNESELWDVVSNKPESDSRIISWDHSLLNIPQGEHSVEFRVQDINGKSFKTVSTPFVIDFGPPGLTIDAPPNGSIQTSSFSIEGTATDPNGVNDIGISFDNGSTYTSVMNEAAGAVDATWIDNFTVETDGSTDGEYSYQVRATDTSGSKTTLDRQFVVDATNPSITVVTPNAGASVNGTALQVQGTSNDNRAVANIWYLVEPVSVAAGDLPVDSTSWNSGVSGLYSWNFDVDTTAFNNTATASDYNIWFRVQDTAGNLPVDYAHSITIDQTTDRPEITFNDINKDETNPINNVIVGATNLSGIIEDDDLIDPALFSGNSIEINIDDNGWEAVSQPPVESGRFVQWKHNIELLAEGEHNVKVRVRDNKSDSTVGTSSADASYNSNFNWNIEDSVDQSGIPFILNLGPPSITTTSPVNYSFHNTDVTIEGSATDANDIKSVDISYDNGTSWTNILDYSNPPTTDPPISPAAWSTIYSFDSIENPDYLDGTISYIVRATDTYDTSSIYNGQFTVDATFPTANIELPAASALVNGNLTIRGTAEDNISLDKVSYNIQPKYTDAPTNSSLTAEPVYPDDYTDFTGNYSWSEIIDTTGLTDEIYTLSVVPVDKAANGSDGVTVVTRDFEVDQNSDKPLIYFSSITSGGTYEDNLVPASKQINGYFEDDDAIDASTVQYKLYDDSDTLLTAITSDWTNISGQPSGDGSPITWTHLLGDAVTDGLYKIQIRTADVNDAGSYTPGGFGWAESALEPIAVDNTNPASSIAPANGDYFNDDFTISGTATDINGIKTVEIEYADYDTADASDTVTITAISDSGGPYNASQAWSYNFDRITADPASELADGIMDYKVYITDRFDRVKTYDRYVNIDTTNPNIVNLNYSSNEPTMGEVNGSVLIQGLPEDAETLINAVYLKATTLDNSAITDPGDDPTSEGWDLLGSTVNINHRINSVAELTNNTTYYVYVIAEDKAGNRTAAADNYVTFTVDQSGNTPVLTLDNSDGAVLSSIEDSLNGTIVDDDGIDETSLEISIDGVWTSITDITTISSKEIDFSYSLSGFSEQLASYSIQVRGSDSGEDFADDTQDIAAITTTTAPISINIDDSDPEITVTDIDNGKNNSASLTSIYVKDQFVISGTSSDGVQVSKVRAKLDGEAWDDADAGIPDVTDEDGDANINTPYDTWSWSRSGLTLTGDSVVLTLQVEDVHGNLTTTSRTLLVDNTVPTVNISTASDTYNGTLTLRGTSSDNIQVEGVYLAEGTSEPANPAGGDPVSDIDYTKLGSTYSWTHDINTTTINSTDSDSTYYITVYAVDGAGNISDRTDLTSNTPDLNFVINQGSDRPVLSLSQPTSGQELGVNANAIGTLSDDDGLSTLQIRADVNQNGTIDADETYQDITTPSGTFINFDYALSTLGLTDGNNIIQLRSEDVNWVDDGSTPFSYVESAEISFFIDTAAPTISLGEILIQDKYTSNPSTSDTSVTTSFNGTYINNDSTLTFTVNDANGILDSDGGTAGVQEGVQISLNGGSTWTDAIADTTDADNNGTYTYALSSGPLSEGTLDIQYKVEDTRGKTTTKVLTVIIDTTEPSVDFSQPTSVSSEMSVDAPNVNGDFLVRGSITDSSSIASLDITGGINSDVELTNDGNNISWQTTVSTSGIYADPDYSYNTGDTGASSWDGVNDSDEAWTNIWRFPIEITAVDYAGNINTTTGTGYVDIDPDGDKPLISVVSPSNGDSVSGSFLVNGTVTDDDGTDYVELQFDFDEDGSYDGLGDVSITNDLNEDSISNDTIDESTPIILDATTGSWSLDLTASDFTISKLAAAGYTNTGNLGIRVIPYDINGLAGTEQTFSVYLDTTSPTIAGLDTDFSTEIPEPTPATGTLKKGTIRLRARFEDDKDLEESSMLISFDGGASFQQISSVTDSTITDQGTTSPYKYYVEIPIDTTDTGIVSGGNGLLDIQLNITDKTNKQSSKSLSYSADNTLPTIQWNEDGSGNLLDLPFAGTPPNETYTFKGNESTGESDDAYKVLGAAIDSGTISGVERVDVYFVDESGTNFWSPRTNETSADVTLAKVADENGTLQTIPYIDSESDLYSEYVIEIQNRIEQGIFDQETDIGDFDGFNESLKAKSGYDEWYSFFDTTLFPDGPITVYAVAYDEAGNTSYTMADGQMSNYPPSIDSFDINSTNYTDSLIRVKSGGTVNMTMNVSDSATITSNASTYEVSLVAKYDYDSGAENAIGAEDTGFTPVVQTQGEIITNTDYYVEIPTSGLVDNDWYKVQGSVTDDDGNLVTRSWYLLVNNSDASDPDITIDPFTQSHVGSNGHIEEAGDSPDSDSQADLSGTVTITGTTGDNVNVGDVDITIDGTVYDTTTTPAVVLTNTDDGDPINGVTYDWSLEFDTSTITGFAQEDLVITADAVDTNGNSNSNDGDAEATDPATLTVDVVPYITGITGAGFDSGLLAYVRRSAQGNYPVQVGDTITITGYNLPGDAAGSVSIGGTVLNSSGTSGVTDTSSIDVVLGPADTSGDVIITTNSATSHNNSNDNLLSQNLEPSAYNSSLTDDRSITFWDVTTKTGTSTVTDPYMNPNSAGDGFEWMYVRSGNELYHYNGTSEKKLTGSTGLRGGAFTYNQDGSLMFLFNHNSQWSFWENTFSFTGSVQFGQIPDLSTYTFTVEQDEAYNWNQNSNFGKLGLGNNNFNYDNTGDSPNPIPYAGYDSLDLGRYKNLKIETIGNDALSRNYVAYFDTGAQESRSIVFYAYQTSTSGGTSATNTVYSNTGLSTVADAGGGITANIDKYSNGANDDFVKLAGTQKNNNSGIATPRGRQEVTEAESGKDSAYFDLAVYDDGTNHYGFIAYFDELNQNLKITANESLNTADPTGALGTWTSPFTVDSSSTAGSFVSMDVDPDGGIHLAYQDNSSGYLKYAYLTYASGGTFTEHETVFVDALFGAGTNNSIKVRNFGGTDYRPVIFTFSSAFTGTTAPLRMSYPVNSQDQTTPGSYFFGAGADSSTGEFLGAWETIALPSNSSPVSESNYLYLNSTNDPHLGYDAANLEEATYLGF